MMKNKFIGTDKSWGNNTNGMSLQDLSCSESEEDIYVNTKHGLRIVKNIAIFVNLIS